MAALYTLIVGVIYLTQRSTLNLICELNESIEQILKVSFKSWIFVLCKLDDLSRGILTFGKTMATFNAKLEQGRRAYGQEVWKTPRFR